MDSSLEQYYRLNPLRPKEIYGTVSDGVRLQHHNRTSLVSPRVSNVNQPCVLLTQDGAALWACLMANTALVWLVGTSTLQIIPSQQDTHS